MAEIYCNILDCPLNSLLETPHQKEGRPGFTPLSGTGVYKGKCSSQKIKIQYRAFRSSTNQVQHVPICTQEEQEEFTCTYRECLFNTAKKQGDEGSCRKFEEDFKDLYVDTVKVFDGYTPVEVSRCESASNRDLGHVDWASAALGVRGGNMKTMPSARDFQDAIRPKIRGSW